MTSTISAVKRIAAGVMCAALSGLAAGPAAAGPAPKSPIEIAARDAFWSGDFAELERQYAIYRQQGRLEPSGTLQIELFRRGLESVFDAGMDNIEPYLQEVDRLTLQWATEHPKSALAHILHARALAVHGWSYRGGSWAKDVPRDAWKDFEAYLRRSAIYLQAHADVALADSSAHYVLLNVGRGLDWKPEQMIAIADDGLRVNPDDIQLMFSAELSLLPKWGGNAKLLDAYINHAVQQTRTRFGTGMYARLYAAAAESEYGYGLFEDSLADWPRMKLAYEDMFARYPDSPYRLNNYAFMACIAKDRKTLAGLLDKIGDAVDLSAWGTNPERGLEGCRRLAAGK